MLLSTMVDKFKLINDNLQNNNHQVNKVSISKNLSGDDVILIETLNPVKSNSNLFNFLSQLEGVEVEFDYFISAKLN
jgi:hypothetical protein